MRLLYSAGALWVLARRWFAFALVLAILLSQYLMAVLSALGWLTLPLFWAASLSMLPGIGVVSLHALPGLALTWALREALLPHAWIAAERALPQTRAQSLTADLAVVVLAQSPLFVLYAGSCLTWGAERPAWMAGLWGRALLALALSILLSLAMGVAMLKGRRRSWHGTSKPAQRPHSMALSPPPALERLGVWAALLLLPLWRGPARSLGVWLLGQCLVLGACLIAALERPAYANWWLAAFALFAMQGSARAQALAQRDLAALTQASRALPLKREALGRSQTLLALAPSLLVWPALLAVLLLGPWQFAPRAGPLYLLAGLTLPALNLYLKGRVAENDAARWLFCLGLWVALATECVEWV